MHPEKGKGGGRGEVKSRRKCITLHYSKVRTSLVKSINTIATVASIFLSGLLICEDYHNHTNQIQPRLEIIIHELTSYIADQTMLANIISYLIFSPF